MSDIYKGSRFSANGKKKNHSNTDNGNNTNNYQTKKQPTNQPLNKKDANNTGLVRSFSSPPPPPPPPPPPYRADHVRTSHGLEVLSQNPRAQAGPRVSSGFIARIGRLQDSLAFHKYTHSSASERRKTTTPRTCCGQVVLSGKCPSGKRISGNSSFLPFLTLDFFIPRFFLCFCLSFSHPPPPPSPDPLFSFTDHIGAPEKIM